MKIWAGIIVLVLLASCQEAKGYSHKKAILLVDREAQADSDGYNFVSDLSSHVYEWISKGQIVLWDSPEKKKHLTFTDLQNVEIKSSTSFKNLKTVYLYENWSSDNKKTSITVDGVLFIDSTFIGQDIIYGFIEFNDTLRQLFENTPMNVNANGNCGTTLYTALMNNGFQFTLLYFDNSPISTYKSSKAIVASAFSAKKQLLNHIPVKRTKCVEYGWDSTSNEQMSLSGQIIKALDSFFNDNRQEFFNFGGDKIYSFLKEAPIAISDFRIMETWTKDMHGKIYFTPQSIVLYTKGMMLQPIPFGKLDDWKIQYNGESLTSFLSAKDYPYTIKKINDTVIPDTLAQSYKDALFAYSWDQILENQ